MYDIINHRHYCQCNEQLEPANCNDNSIYDLDKINAMKEEDTCIYDKEYLRILFPLTNERKHTCLNKTHMPSSAH